VCVVFVYPDFVGLQLNLETTEQLSFLVQGAILWWLLGFGAYHTIHQLREVSRAHEEYLRVNIYDLGNLYALSSMAAVSSILVIAPVTLALLVMPEYVLQPMGLAFIGLCSVVAAVTLTWPTWNLHRAIFREKSRILSECSARYQSLLEEWHSRLDERKLEGNAELSSAIRGVALEREELRKIPTWPWSPGILRGWLASLLLPLAIWILQLVLENAVFGS